MPVPIVLVHGSFHGAWCWSRLAPLLERAGHRVLVPELPASGSDPAPPSAANLANYVERVAGVVEALDEPPLLVGHSMGAIVCSQVAQRCGDRLAGVVFVCGLLLRPGETLVSFLKEFEHLGIEDLVLKHMQVSADGALATFPQEHAATVFYHRCSPADAAWAARQLRPQATAVYGEATVLTPERFGRVRRFYVEGTDDRAVSPTYQRLMVQRTPCERVFRVDSDHSPFLSAPGELADVLLAVADAVAGPKPGSLDFS